MELEQVIETNNKANLISKERSNENIVLIKFKQ